MRNHCSILLGEYHWKWGRQYAHYILVEGQDGEIFILNYCEGDLNPDVHGLYANQYVYYGFNYEDGLLERELVYSLDDFLREHGAHAVYAPPFALDEILDIVAKLRSPEIDIPCTLSMLLPPGTLPLSDPDYTSAVPEPDCFTKYEPYTRFKQAVAALKGA